MWSGLMDESGSTSATAPTNTFGDVDDEDGHVDDLRAAYDRADQAGVPRAVHQRHLDLVEGLLRQALRQGHLQPHDLHLARA